MKVKETINKRRAYRSLDPVEITEEFIKDLAECAQLTPSCFNNQPWRFVFAYDKEILQKLFTTMSRGNEWTHYGSMIIVVLSKKELDCDIKGREYFLFDTGMATAFMILRATELGFVAHPIAGFHEEEVKTILNIPEDMKVITLVIVGKHADDIKPLLTEKQVKDEPVRPERLPLEKFAYYNNYSG